MEADYPDDADGDALRRIAAGGADMSKPMDFNFFVAAFDEATAKIVADKAAEVGYHTETFFRDNVEPGSWNCKCSKSMVPTYSSLVAAQAELDAIARPLGAHVDSWGTYGGGEKYTMVGKTDRAWKSFLQEQALTEIDFRLLDEIYMTVAMRMERLINWTLNNDRDPVAMPRAEVELAVRSLLDRGLLLEIDEQSLSAIHLLLDRSQLVPACGFPEVGDIDLSLRGSALMIRWSELVFGSLDGSAARTMRYGSSDTVLGTDRKAVADFIEVCLETDEDFVEAGEITPCGPWCSRWWHVYPVGFACEVTLRDPRH